MKFKNLNYKKIAVISGIVLAYGIVFGFFIIPKIIKVMIKHQVRLKPGNQQRDIWNAIPFPLHFLIYVFNITNPDEFINGGIAKVQEIGPYYFDEWKDKFDQTENEEEDSITFHMRNTWIFRPDLSNGLTGEEEIYMPHPLISIIAILIKRTRPPMLSLVAKGLSQIFSNDFDKLYKGKVMDIFFRGLPVDCNKEEFSAKAICTAFYGGEVKNALQHNETLFLFSFLKFLNHSSSGEYTVCRGIKNVHKLGKVIKYNDEEELDVWKDDHCNKFQGTDGTIFPPFLEPEDGIWAFAPDVCRSLSPVYRRKSKYAGLPASRYTLDFGDLKNEKENHCFCGDNPPDDCPVKGTMNLAPCLDNAPLIASMPHFLNGDESLFENVEGLQPNEDKHITYVDFERTSGSPFKAAKRLQLNLDQEPIDLVEPLAKVRKMVVPLFWVEEGVALNKTYVNIIRPLFIGTTFNEVTRWMSIVFGSLGIILSLFMHKKNSDTIKISNTKINENGVKDTALPALNDSKTSDAISATANANVLQNNDINLNGHTNLKLYPTQRY